VPETLWIQEMNLRNVARPGYEPMTCSVAGKCVSHLATVNRLNWFERWTVQNCFDNIFIMNCFDKASDVIQECDVYPQTLDWRYGAGTTIYDIRYPHVYKIWQTYTNVGIKWIINIRYEWRDFTGCKSEPKIVRQAYSQTLERRKSCNPAQLSVNNCYCVAHVSAEDYVIILRHCLLFHVTGKDICVEKL